VLEVLAFLSLCVSVRVVRLFALCIFACGHFHRLSVVLVLGKEVWSKERRRGMDGGRARGGV